MRDCGGGGGDINPYCCHLHPKEVMVGVCALCLKEKLLVLASKQPHEEALMRKPSIKLGKVFALGSFLQRLEINRQGHERSSDDADVDSINEISEASIASLEDSFISIKLEENGHVSWHGKKTCASISTIPYTSITCGSAALGKGKRSSTVEHGHREGGGPRWRSRIAQLLQLAQWKRSSKGSSSHVGRFRGRKSSAWMITSLTRKRRRRRRRRSSTADR